MRKVGPRTMKLFLLCTFGLAMFGATAAQAEVGAHWNINGTALNNNTLLPALATTLNGSGSLLARAIAELLRISCTTLTLEEAVLKSEGGALGKAKFSGCAISSKKKETEEWSTLAACEPKTGTENGVILTRLLKALIVLGESSLSLLRVEPEEGTTLVIIKTTGTECGFGSSIPIIGKFAAEDGKAEFKMEQVTHLLLEGPSTELWILSKTAEHKATVTGTADVFLTGMEHVNLKWSGTPA